MRKHPIRCCVSEFYKTVLKTHSHTSNKYASTCMSTPVCVINRDYICVGGRNILRSIYLCWLHFSLSQLWLRDLFSWRRWNAKRCVTRYSTNDALLMQHVLFGSYARFARAKYRAKNSQNKSELKASVSYSWITRNFPFYVVIVNEVKSGTRLTMNQTFGETRTDYRIIQWRIGEPKHSLNQSNRAIS